MPCFVSRTFDFIACSYMGRMPDHLGICFRRVNARTAGGATAPSGSAAAGGGSAYGLLDARSQRRAEPTKLGASCLVVLARPGIGQLHHRFLQLVRGLPARAPELG